MTPSLLPGLVDEDHLEVVGEGGEHSSVGFEVDVSNSDCAVAQKAKLPLNVELLQQEEAVRRNLHVPQEPGSSEKTRGQRCGSNNKIPRRKNAKDKVPITSNVIKNCNNSNNKNNIRNYNKNDQ